MENWIDAMIAREAIPKAAREDTVAEFCAKWGLTESNYYYHSSKPENQQQIIDLCFKQAKRSTPEILQKLGESAEKGDTKAIEMFLKFILEKAEKQEQKIKAVVEVSKEGAEKYELAPRPSEDTPGQASV